MCLVRLHSNLICTSWMINGPSTTPWRDGTDRKFCVCPGSTGTIGNYRAVSPMPFKKFLLFVLITRSSMQKGGSNANEIKEMGQILHSSGDIGQDLASNRVNPIRRIIMQHKGKS